MTDFIKTGNCIWCGRSYQDTSFDTAPHIVPHSLGGPEIGFDVCDDCNHHFGTAQRGVPSIDLAFKEVFNAFRTFGRNLDENTHKHFSSVFFQYWHSKHKIIVKRNFNSKAITRQFKRGLYEVFLQKYHSVTGNGNHPMFDMVRRFARFGEGNPHVFYAFNNIILVTEDDEKAWFHMSEKSIKEMLNSGLYRFWLFGHVFYIEILPLAFNMNGHQFLQQEAINSLIPVKGNERIFEFSDIMEIDFLMGRFNSRNG